MKSSVDESAKLAKTIEEVRAATGAYIDSWPDRMSPESIRKKAESCRRKRSNRPVEHAERAAEKDVA
ncbi:MAG: hypothetical protein EBT03_12490 [Betaproteobacteria bacterium]|nr:hypothetical protein [Betaproteobacteria bacterium]